MKKKQQHLFEHAEHIPPSARTWAGAEEVVLSVVAQSPRLFAPNVRMKQLPGISATKIAHQKRQVARRNKRSHDATGQNVAFAGIEGERYTYSDVARAVRLVNRSQRGQ